MQFFSDQTTQIQMLLRKKFWKNLKRNEEWHNGDDLLHDNADYQITIMTSTIRWRFFLWQNDSCGKNFGSKTKSVVNFTFHNIQKWNENTPYENVILTKIANGIFILKKLF